MVKIEDNEKILTETRRHWFFLALELLGLVPLLFVPILLLVLFNTVDFGFLAGNNSPLNLTGDSSAGGLTFFLISTWLLFIWAGLFSIWTDYYLDIIIVTNKRVIDVEQKGLFSREVSSLRLEKIQDVTVSVDGILATLFRFGNLHIQTAGESGKFSIRYIKDAYALKEIIVNAQNAREDAA